MAAVEEIVSKIRQRQLTIDLQTEIIALRTHQDVYRCSAKALKAQVEKRLAKLQEQWNIPAAELAVRMNKLLEEENKNGTGNITDSVGE